MKQSIIGFTFIVALGIVLYLSMTLSGTGSLAEVFGTPAVTVRMRFDSVVGLKERDQVMVSGVPVGSVSSMRLMEGGGVLVEARIDADAVLYGDASAEMFATGALGGKAVDITPGTAGSGVLPDDRIMSGNFVPDVLVAAAKAIQNLEPAIENVNVSLAKVRKLIENVEEGKGTLGVLFSDQETAERVRSLVRNLDDATQDFRGVAREAQTALEQVNNGRGTINRILYDETMSDNLADTIASAKRIGENVELAVSDARAVIAKINRGDGLIATLLNDKELSDNAKELVRNTNEGVQEVRGVVADVGSVVTKIDEGKGTIGRLINEDTLYNDLLRAINTLQAGFEDLREQAPVTTFASVIFQVFQ